MLQAQNGRQLNLAAKAVRAFFDKKNVNLSQNEALKLVSHLIGYPSFEAAQAALEGTRKGVSSDVQSWRNLAHSIGTLSDEQLSMAVIVSDGCDENGNATFAKAFKLAMPDAEYLAASAGMFGALQPVLLIDKLGSNSSEAEVDSEDEYRVGMQLECATDESASLAGWHIERKGLEEAIEYLNSEYDCNISLGKFVAYSEAEKGFWNRDFGFVTDKASATGFDSREDLPQLAGTSDLEMVTYAEAVDVDPDAKDEFNHQVRGERVSRYQWPLRYESLWSQVRPRITELLEATKNVVEAKGFSTKIVSRDHANGTGEQLVLNLYSPEKVYGGRLVFAFADGLKGGFVRGAALGVFVEIPERESMAYSLNVQRNGAFPFATEAHFFIEEMLEQTPQKMGDWLMLCANFEHKLSDD
jgi:hypothetical protein